MSTTPRIFLNEDFSIDKEIKIIDKTYHYIANVMRKKIDDEIILINGKDGEFLSKIIFINNKYLILKITKQTKKYKKSKFLGLIFSPIQKIDLLLKSATELGVSDFILINTEYTSKNNIKTNKIDGNIIEAIEQCERLDLPEITKIDSLKNVLEKIDKENSIIFFCEERSGQNSPLKVFQNIKIDDKKIYALIGPEGGFSQKEKDLIRSYKNVVSINLGENILRAETACISIISILKVFYYQD